MEKIIEEIVRRLLENIKKEKVNNIVYHSSWYNGGENEI